MSLIPNKTPQACFIACDKATIDKGLCSCMNMSMEFKLPCLEFIGILNEAHAKCKVCGKEEWQHKL